MARNPTESASHNELFDRACRVLPGGVSRNTVYRAPQPNYAVSGDGCYLDDIHGVRRLDCSNNMASLIHGHVFPPIVDAVQQQLQRGTAFTMATEAEVLFAELLCSRVPSIDRIRFVNSGTEAVMVAIKIARCFAGRPKIAKVEGAYHGTYDYAEASQQSRPGDWGEADQPTAVPVAEGTPQGALDDVVVVPFNNIERSLALLDAQAERIAAVLIDPLPHRVGLVSADEDYVQALFNWTRRNDALFIFDEVITFRSEFIGAAGWYDVQADLTALGKIIGGGFPVGAIGGRADVMAVMDPSQTQLRLPHSGTFSANPITMTAGRVAMEHFDEAAVEHVNRLGDRARAGITAAIRDAGVNACVTGAGSMLRVHLKSNPPANYRQAFMDDDTRRRVTWLVENLLQRGFLMINTCSAALSTPMTEKEIDQLVAAVGEALIELDETL